MCYMVMIILGTALVLIGLLALALQRLFSSIPARELRRLAAHGDKMAARLYRPAAYGANTRLLLWAVACLSLAAGVLILAANAPALVIFVVLVVILIIALVWLPSQQLTLRSAGFAAWFSPIIVWVVAKTLPLLNFLTTHIGHYRGLDQHSRLYEKTDLVGLLASQKDQIGNRISEHDLELAERALVFADKRVGQILVPVAKLHLVASKEVIGPILQDHLHKSGQKIFLVYKGKKENLIGSLSLAAAVNAKQGEHVAELMTNNLAYVNEDYDLRETLAAFAHGHKIAVVVNNFNEVVGAVTLQGIIEELRGVELVEGLPYEDRASTAAYVADNLKSEEKAEPKPHEDISSPESTEVVE